MNNIFSIYCDESCHLEHDRQNAMVLGGIWCPDEKRKLIARQLRELMNGACNSGGNHVNCRAIAYALYLKLKRKPIL